MCGYAHQLLIYIVLTARCVKKAWNLGSKAILHNLKKRRRLLQNGVHLSQEALSRHGTINQSTYDLLTSNLD
jgi:hypothetical protein